MMAVRLDGGERQPPVEHAFRGQQTVGDFLDFSPLPAQNDHFQAMMMIQVDVQRGDNGRMMVRLS